MHQRATTRMRSFIPDSRERRHFARFDRENGQVFSESTSEVRSMRSSWLSAAPRKLKTPAPHRCQAKGAAPLGDMALRACAKDAESFTAELLSGVEWLHARKIFFYLKER